MRGRQVFARIPRAKRLFGVPALLPFGLNQMKRILPATRHRAGIIGASEFARQRQISRQQRLNPPFSPGATADESHLYLLQPNAFRSIAILLGTATSGFSLPSISSE